MKRREFLAATLAFGAATALRAETQSAARVLAAMAGLLDRAAVARLRQRVKGHVFVPGDAEYERLRRGLSAKIDRHPALVVQSTTADDVRYAVDFARGRSFPIAIRGGAHSLAGHSTCDGGVVIDLSGLRRVTVDAKRHVVRAGGGTLLGAIDRATAPHGLATVLGECPTVGVGGLHSAAARAD